VRVVDDVVGHGAQQGSAELGEPAGTRDDVGGSHGVGVADNAVKHALKFYDKLNADIYLLHIVKKKEQIPEFEEKLKDRAQKIKQEYGISPHVIVRDGTIFKTINIIVNEIDTDLVVMGTHGMKGLQKLTGSWALKVIVGSKVPYLVVQEPPNDIDVVKIVYPVDYRIENKEMLTWVQQISNFSMNNYTK